MSTVLRRTTLIVRDLEQSLRFYAEVFGLTVWYDSRITVGGEVLPAGEPGALTRVVILQAKDPLVGMIGLMQYLEPPLAAPPPPASRLGIGDIVFVMETDDLPGVHARLRAAGARIHCPPYDWEVPNPAGGPAIKLTTLSFFDPDGFFIEVNAKR
jgi:catechol 2,3-dioxygenase-like lactoylglutathione lyase family enzyme